MINTVLTEGGVCILILKLFPLTINHEDTAMFDRITAEPQKMGGVPCIRGLRIPVATILGMLADGMKAEEILNAYPDLEMEDIEQTLHFAAVLAKDRQIKFTFSA